jgi:hypothetical protein
MKFYFSRENIIDAILNEDAALDAPTSSRKRSKFVTDANEREDKNSDKDIRKSRGGQSKAGVNAGELIFRKPTAAEIDAVADKFNRNLGGDRQIVQIRALSKVLFDFDLLDKVYKAKKDDWNAGKSNSSEVDKISKNITRVLKKYSPETPVEVVAEDLENSTSRLEKLVGVRIPELLGAIESWAQIIKNDPRTKSADFPTGFNPLLMKNIESVVDNNIVNTYKKVVDLLIDAAPKYNTPKAYSKYVAGNETMRAVLDEPLVKRGFDAAMSTGSVQDVEELELYLTNFLNKNRIERQEGNTMTIIHDIAVKRLQYFDLLMKRKGYEGGIRNFGEMIDFLQEYRPETYEHVCRTYGLDDESIRQFNSYKDFCNWLFGDPDNFNNILLSVPTNVRSRTKGAVAKGMDMAVRRKELMNKERNLRDKLDAPSGSKRGKRARTIEEIEKEMERIAEVREMLRNDLKKHRENGDTDSPEYAEIKKLEFDAGKQYAALKLTLKKRKAAGDSQDIKSLEDRLSDYRDKREQLEDRVFDRLESDDEMAEFNREFNRDKSREEMGDFDLGSGYRTMSFSLKLSPKEIDVVDSIVQNIEKYLNGKEIKAGREGLINVDFEPGRYNGGMRMYPCTRFVIDYPEKSDLFKNIKSTPKKERGVIIADIISHIQKRAQSEYGISLNLVTGDPEHKIKLMAKNDASYSFKD